MLRYFCSAFMCCALGTVKRATITCNLFCNLLQNELKDDVVHFTTHVQTCLATNQVVAGCVKLSKKVEFYFLQQLLLRSKWRNFRVWRDSRVVLSNQKSVSTQLCSRTRCIAFQFVLRQWLETSCTFLPLLRGPRTIFYQDEARLRQHAILVRN